MKSSQRKYSIKDNLQRQKSTFSEINEKELNEEYRPKDDYPNEYYIKNEGEIHLNLQPHSNIIENIIVVENPDNNKHNDNYQIRIYHKFQNVFDSCDEKEREMDREPLFLIEINSKFQIAWEYFMLFTIVYSAFWSPINLCFSDNSHINEIIEILIEISLIIDIFLAFHTQIEDNTETIISSSKIISYSYLKGWFFLDVITCFPASLIQIFAHGNKLLTYLRWFGLVRLLKIIKYPFLINKRIFENERLDNLVKNFMFLIIMFNTLSCFFIFIGLNNSDRNNWIVYNHVDINQNISIYIASLFFHLLTISTTGFGGIEGVSNGEKIYSILLFILVTLLFPFIVVSISKVLAEDDPSQIIFYSKLTRLGKVHKKLKFGKSLKSKISQALKMENEKKFNQRSSFFDFLPISARHQLNSYIYNNSLKNFQFFQYQTYDFILFSIPYLRHHHLRKGQYIYNIGEKVDEMFMVSKGALSICLGSEFSNLELAVLRQNSYFGDIFLFTNKISPFNCKVKNDKTEIFIITSEDYLIMKTRYPKNILNIMEFSSYTLNFLNERKKNLINLLEQEKTKENVIYKLRVINAYLLERDFDEYFYNNREIENVNEFLIKNPFNKVKYAIDQMNRKRKKFLSVKVNNVSKMFFKNILNIDKSPLPQVAKGNKASVASLQDIEDKRYSMNSRDSNKKNSEMKKLDSMEIERFDRNVNKILNIKEIQSDGGRGSKGKGSSFYMNRNTIKDDEPSLDKSRHSCFKPSPLIILKPPKNNKKKLKKEYFELLKDIYAINFEQELDISSLKKEKEIGNKISEIIVSNKQKENVNEIAQVKNDKIKKIVKEEVERKNFPLKTMYSLEKVVQYNNLPYMANSMKTYSNADFAITSENSFSFSNELAFKKSLIHSFKNMKIVKNNSITFQPELVRNHPKTRKSFGRLVFNDPTIFKDEKLELDVFKVLRDDESFKKKTEVIKNLKPKSPTKSPTKMSKRSDHNFFDTDLKLNNYIKTPTGRHSKNERFKKLGDKYNNNDLQSKINKKLDKILHNLKKSPPKGTII